MHEWKAGANLFFSQDSNRFGISHMAQLLFIRILPFKLLKTPKKKNEISN
jgi:hypothetical protein